MLPPSFAVLTEVNRREIKVSRSLRRDPGHDLGHRTVATWDYEWFPELTHDELYFVTRMKQTRCTR